MTHSPANKKRFLWSSDHHTLHPKTPTNHILNNMTTFHMKDHKLSEVDMVVFGGDLFDKLVDASNKDLIKVLEWYDNFLLECDKHNVIVRSLEGTTSHEWGQQKHIRHQLVPSLNYRYVDTLSIEIIPEMDDLSIMYVPDNLSGTKNPDEIWEMALGELNKHKLTKVDVIFGHMGFRHQLPEKGWKHAHMLERWSSIVNYEIFAGHIHIPMEIEKFKCSGSFDRLRHGEDHPKGGFVCDYDKSKKIFDVKFWENKNALPYKTIKLTKEMELGEVIKLVYSYIKKTNLPANSHIRLKGGNSAIVNPLVNQLILDFQYYNFIADNATNEDLLIDDKLFDNSQYKGVTIVKENIFDMIKPEIEEELSRKNISLKDAKKVLKEFL